MFKPRCGFYITEKFPKAPDGEEVKVPEGAVVFYDAEALLNAPEEELLKYCEDLILYYGLEFKPEELLDIIMWALFFQSLPKDKNRLKRVLKRLPCIAVEE